MIRAAISAAWKGVVREIAAGRCEATSEVPITLELQRALNHLLNEYPSSVRGFSAAIFETVVRGGEVESYDGRSLEKRPDLTIRLAGLPLAGIDRAHHGLFIECKLLDAKHSPRAYCENGIMRFVRGEYAWAMPHALMIGYVAGCTHRADEFPRFLNAARERYQVDGDPTLEYTSYSPSQTTIRSRHSRTWRYPITEGEPGAVDILHYWLGLS